RAPTWRQVRSSYFRSSGVNLRAAFPIVAELADQIERAGDENGVVGGDFGEVRSGDSARSVGRCKDDLRGVREEEAGDFVDGFIAKGGVEQKDFAAGEIHLEEMSKLAGGAGIVRAIEINVRVQLQFFEPAGPDSIGDALRDGFIGNLEAATVKEARGGEGVQCVLE